jgi:hypothetical protein
MKKKTPRPISEAPLVRVLGWLPDEVNGSGVWMVVVPSEIDRLGFRSKGSAVKWVIDDDDDYEVRPTHFVPLPPDVKR